MYEYIAGVDLKDRRSLVYASGFILGIFGIHRISELHKYEVRMLIPDINGNGLWVEYDDATKTTPLVRGNLLYFFSFLFLLE